MRHGVIFLPGIITPADLAYGDLRAALNQAGKMVLRDLAVYDGEAPPADYSLDKEIASVLEAAATAGFDRFHLAGYSGGGAVSAALAARHPDRLTSLALFEPAWFGNEGMRPGERRVREELDEKMRLPPAQALPEFVRLALAPGVAPPPPPPGEPPPWMAKRPAGIRAITGAFASHKLDMEALRNFPRPVLFVLGRLSNQDFYGEIAERAAEVFPDFTLEIFEERHHFDPPHRAEPERLAGMLRDFWEGAEKSLGS